MRMIITVIAADQILAASKFTMKSNSPTVDLDLVSLTPIWIGASPQILPYATMTETRQIGFEARDQGRGVGLRHAHLEDRITMCGMIEKKGMVIVADLDRRTVIIMGTRRATAGL